MCLHEKAVTVPQRLPVSTFWWLVGGFHASLFSMVYFVAPFYMISASVALLCRFPSASAAGWFASPIFVSALFQPIPVPLFLRLMRPMLSYFDYEECIETSPINCEEEILVNKKNYLIVAQPHGALSYVGICSAVNAGPEWQGKLKTAVADAVMYTPIVKHVLGIFGLISASKQSMKQTLKRPGVEGCAVLYVGGLAELFLSDERRERVYLNKRKGFIKLALQTGVDIIPLYLFGNTTVLSVLKTGLLASISRRFQVSLTYIWGKLMLPIPRDCKLLYASGQPVGLPHIENPTQEDIDKWHAEYCKQVKRLFDKYKERVPQYKHKQLEIL